MPPSIPAQDTRDKFIGVRGAPEDIAAVFTHAATRGLTGRVWARNTLLDALEAATGWRDMARRAAARRPNKQPRKDRQGDPADLQLRVSPAEHEHITDLVTSQGMTITKWAWSVITEALEKERK